MFSDEISENYARFILSRIKLGALSAPSDLTSPCEALRGDFKSASVGAVLVLLTCFSAVLGTENR